MANKARSSSEVWGTAKTSLAVVFLALLYWVVESVVDTLVFFPELGLFGNLLPGSHEVTMRLIAIFLLVGLLLSYQYAIKDRDEAKKKLQIQQTAAIASDRLKSLGEMASGIAHELSQPLMGIRGFAEHVMLGFDRQWDMSQADIRKMMVRIVEQADRMNHIVDHVRMFSMESNRLEVRPVQVNEVITMSVELMATHMRHRGIELECVLAEDLPKVSANPFSLEEVLMNLTTNARDAFRKEASSDQEVAGKIVLRSSLLDEGEETFVKVEVVDDGMGIADEVMPRIFDPFFTTKEPGSGAGLGLAVARSIIEKMDGELTVQSQEGVGTTTGFKLPVPSAADTG